MTEEPEEEDRTENALDGTNPVPLCKCGRPSGDDGYCPRCRYYNSIFFPPQPVFESKRERALKAIEFRRMFRGRDRVVVNQE